MRVSEPYTPNVRIGFPARDNFFQFEAPTVEIHVLELRLPINTVPSAAVRSVETA
jgi:hypothetical protein